ncbi:MAG: sodium:proton antiporter, partial [Chlamydiales bacterium]|nr:sodium:proton antiporter [Chlamydiales bacterium]
ELILTIVLPPILHSAAFWTSLREFKQHARKICSLALGLVVVTTVVVASIFKLYFPELPWALAFVFGAIVSPPDAAAATSILKRFPLGTKLITILEGESLVNDASALVLYRIALTALVTGSFSLLEASEQFLYMSLGGALFGASINYILQKITRKCLDPVVGTFTSFLIPYITYIVASWMGISAVLAVVAGGIVSSRMIFKNQTSLRRMIGRVTWDMYIIILNCFVFILIGSQLDEQTSHMTWAQVGTYTGFSLVITFIMFAVRMAWVSRKSSQEGLIIGWVGMRGIVSLTAALALPFTLNNGMPTPGREIVIYMVFCVILFTLLIPSLTLGKLIQWLKLPPNALSDPTLDTRRNLIEVAKKEIHKLHSANAVSEEERNLLHNYFDNRHRLWELISPESGNHSHLEAARKKVVQAQRKVLLAIWEEGTISDRILAQIEHELDSEETREVRAEI